MQDFLCYFLMEQLGTTIKYILENYIREKENKMGYEHVATPSLATTELYKISGHWDHYKDDMFPVMKMDNEEMVLRPMNCPHHMLIYKSELHSYKEELYLDLKELDK